MRLIDADALMEYCLNQKIKTIDCNDIARFPTIEERKTGEWIPKSESGCIIECSSCGERMTVLGDENPNFCPYCGSYNGDKSDDIPIEYFENGGI